MDVIQVYGRGRHRLVSKIIAIPPFRKVPGSSDEIGKSRWGEILSQIEVWKMEEYFVYFPFFKLISWGKRSASCRRRFLQSFPKNKNAPDRNTVSAKDE